MQQLHAAIVSAFTYVDLAMLLKFDLAENLDHLVPNGPVNQVVFDLIQWGEQTGRTEELIRAAVRQRPHNPQVKAVADLLLPATPPPPTGGAAFDGPRRARLRAMLLEQFPKRSELAMLLDDTLSQSLDQIEGGSNLTETVFELAQWLAVDLNKRLQPLLEEAKKRRPNSAELAALHRELFGV